MPSASPPDRAPAARARRVLGAALGAALALGAAGAAAKPEPGQKFKDWAAACDKVKVPPPEGQEGAEPAERELCYVFQNITLKETGKRLLHVAVGYVGGTDRPAAIFTLPLGIFLPPGLAIAIDGGEPKRFPVQQCFPNGCRAVLPLDEALVGRLKAGRQATVSFFDPARREIGVPVSLLGFTAALGALQD